MKSFIQVRDDVFTTQIPKRWFRNALVAAGLPPDEKRRPQIGRNRRRLLIVYDPDVARSELMEPKTVGKRRPPASHPG